MKDKNKNLPPASLPPHFKPQWEQLLCADEYGLRKLWKRIVQREREHLPAERDKALFSTRYQKSHTQFLARQSALPTPKLNQNLPVLAHQSALLALGKLENIQILAGNEPDAAAFMVGKAKFMIPLAGIIDKAAELARLQKELEKLEKNIAKLTAQLANEKFVQSAPEHLVALTRAILEKDQQTQSALLEQREKIAAL